MNEPSFTIEVESPYPVERRHYRNLLSAEDLDSLVKRYPIYKSNVLDPVHRVLRLADRNAYIDTLLYLIRGDVSLANQLRTHMGTWTETLINSS